MDHLTAQSLQQLIKKADIVDIIGKHVTLKKAGTNYIGCCPFHQETIPSFSISREKGLYYCFGCKAKGNVLSFVMQHDRLNLVDAAEALAGYYGIELEYSQRDTSENKALEEVLQTVLMLYREHMSLEALNFCHARGITDTVIAQYCLGYARDLRHCSVPQEQLIAAGLVRKTEHGQCFEVFQNRLIFPIRNSRGICVGFGGRVLGHTLPKYINSRESTLFQKRDVLYGAYEMLTRNPHPAEILLVEGYCDVLSLVSKGYPTVVATLGTAVSHPQARKLLELTRKVVVCFDGDQAGLAGQQHAFTQFGQLLKQQHDLFFCTLPTGYDPDSYVQRYGLAALQQVIASATHHLDYFITISEGATIFETITNAQTFISYLDNPPYQLALAHKLAQVYQLHPQHTIAALLPQPQRSTPQSRLPLSAEGKAPLSLRDQALAYMLQYPQSALTVMQTMTQSALARITKPIDALTCTLFSLQQNVAIANSAVLLFHIQEHYPEYSDYCQELTYYPFYLSAAELEEEFIANMEALGRCPHLALYPLLAKFLPADYFQEALQESQRLSPDAAGDIITILKQKYLIWRSHAIKTKEQS